MAKKLYELVEIIENNMECVVLKVKEGSELDLIFLGFFDGTEKMFRLTKGAKHICTVWTEKGNYSWHWGGGSSTCVTDEMIKRGNLIQACIEEDFEICIEGSKEALAKSLYIKSLDDVKNIEHTFKVMGENTSSLCVHRDDSYFKHMSIVAFEKMLEEKEYKTVDATEYRSSNGCLVRVIKVKR